MKNNAQKDTYDKLMVGNGNDLFSESGFDEMQKIKNHEIGFGLFRIFFWVMYAASLAIMLIAYGLEITVFTIIGYGLMFLCMFFYFLYAAKASAAGVMNQKFAENMSKKSTLSAGIVSLTLLMLLAIENKAVTLSAGMWIQLAMLYIGNYLCARKNMKVLEKMTKEDESDER